MKCTTLLILKVVFFPFAPTLGISPLLPLHSFLLSILYTFPILNVHTRRNRLYFIPPCLYYFRDSCYPLKIIFVLNIYQAK